MPRRTPPSPTDWLLIIPTLIIILFLFLPILGLLLKGIGGNLIAALLMPASLQALRLTLLTSLLSIVIIILLGTPLAFVLAWWEFKGKRGIEMLVDLPLVLPPSVAGLGLLLAFGRQGLLGTQLNIIGISIPFTTAAVIMAQLFVSTPFYVRSARTGFAALDVQLEEAALVEGANAWKLFSLVTIPLSRRALASGTILALARAIGEFGATILFAGNLRGVTQTMPLAIYLGFETSIDMAVALSVILVLVSGILLWSLRKLEDVEKS